MVDVSSQSNKVNITVSSSGVSSNVNASGDTTLYYSNKAREWAISNRIVDGVDYSSKYYAGRANQSALNAQSFAQSAQDSYNNFQDSVTDSLNTIDDKVQEATENIKIQKQDTITEIQDIATNQKEEIENLSEQEQNKIVDLGIDTRANVDLSNLSAIGEKHFLNKQQITNCITEIPQRIKYTLEDGTLTIKAGSVVIVPYGTEDLTAQYPVGSTFLHDNFKVYDTQFEDGKFFVWAELQNDISNFATAQTTKELLISIRIDVNGIMAREASACYSGTSDSISSTTTHAFYNVSENLLYIYTINGQQEGVYALPIAVAQGDGTHLYSKINQVFNGMGYIGFTIWVDKGIKSLIADGKNEDGTFNNIEFVTSTLTTFAVSAKSPRAFGYEFDYGYISTLKTNFVTGLEANKPTSMPNTGLSGLYYATDTSKYYFTPAGATAVWTPAKYIPLGNVITDENTITKISFKDVFRAVDYNDFTASPLVKETYRNGASWYRIWSDGWIEQGGHKTSTTVNVTLLKGFSDTNYLVLATQAFNNTANYSEAHPVVYGKTTTSFNLKAQYQGNDYTGQNRHQDWYACGY